MVLVYSVLNIVSTALVLVFLVGGSNPQLVYMIVYPDGSYREVNVDLLNESSISVYGLNISIVYSERLVSIEYTVLRREYSEYSVEIPSQDNTSRLIEFSTIHVYLETGNNLYIDLYYDRATDILVYALILDPSSGDEYEVIIRTTPQPITISSKTTIHGSTDTSSIQYSSKPVETTIEQTTRDKSDNVYVYPLIATILVIIALIIWRKWRK